MNNAQKWIIGVAGAIIALMGMFPPWLETLSSQSHKLGFSPLFDPPNPTQQYFSVEVDTQRLLIAWAVVAIIAAVCFVLARKKSNG